jgi:glyoxylase-like metal-dependent hydrolase (beta-lactamase superfamily II)
MANGWRSEHTAGRSSWAAGIRPNTPASIALHLKVLISGDQVLPRISSNVSVHPTEPDADPMSDWLDSLDRLQALVPDDVLVLPAHNECFRGLHTRMDALRRGQEIALNRLRRSLAEPRRAVDVFGALFGRADPARPTRPCWAWPPAKAWPA